MPTDLLGRPLDDIEARLLAAYTELKDLTGEDLPPCAAANLRVALSALAISVVDLGLVYEHLIDHGC